MKYVKCVLPNFCIILLYMEEEPTIDLRLRASKLLQFKFDERELRDKLDKWRCLQGDVPRTNVSDCVINSLHFLDIIKNQHVANDLANIANKHSNISLEQLLNLLFTFLDNKHIIGWYPITDTVHDGYSDWYSVIKEQLLTGYASLLLLRSNDLIGHAVIVYKDIHGKLYIFDPQQYSIYDEDNWRRYFLANDYSNMYLIYKSGKRLYSSTKSNIRKSKISDEPPLKRTRRSTSPPKSPKKSKRTQRSRTPYNSPKKSKRRQHSRTENIFPKINLTP